MTDCPDPIDIEAWLDGETLADGEAIAAHLATCKGCARIARETEAIDRLVADAAARVTAPPPRHEAGPDRASVSRRRTFLIGAGALAASAAGLMLLERGRRDGRALDRLAETYFGDFRTLLVAQRRLDVAESDPQRLLDWFEARVPFAMPMLAGLEAFDLRGGRLCWLDDRRNAAFDFDAPGGGCCLYCAEAGGAPDRPEPVLLERDGLSGAFWRAEGVTHALVGEPGGRAFAAVTQAFVPAGMPS